jgi:SEC-C motif domain protein
MSEPKTSCPCGSAKAFQECCGPFLSGEKRPETAEQLMRSRYTAYTVVDVPYLKRTLAPEARKGFEEADTKAWAEKTKWKKLSILSTKKGSVSDTKGIVEFSAFYELEGEEIQHHEVSKFRKDDEGQWFFVDGDAHSHPADEDIGDAHKPQETVVRKGEKVGRNDPCTCGSGKKFKKCCGSSSL